MGGRCPTGPSKCTVWNESPHPYLGQREGGEVTKAIIESAGLDVCAMERYLKINLHREEGNVWPLGQHLVLLL